MAARIKSPLLYQLSYRPKQSKTKKKPAEEPPGDHRTVSPVYPNGASGLKPDVKVVVIDGLARGLVGRTIELAKVTFGDIPVWAVEFPPPLGVRSIRQDFLRLEAA